MSYKLTNISGGQLVCDLKVGKGKDPKTLRLDNKQSKVVEDTEVTKHIDNLVSKGLLLKEEVKTKTAQKSTKEKEE